MEILVFFAALLIPVSSYRFGCIGHGKCICDTSEQLIDCFEKDLTYFPWFGDSLLAGFKRIGLVGNDIQGPFPDEQHLMDILPDLEMMDFTGNHNLNCTELALAYKKIHILSNCPQHKTSIKVDKSDIGKYFATSDDNILEERPESTSHSRNCNLWCEIDNQVTPVAYKAMKTVTKGLETMETEVSKGYKAVAKELTQGYKNVAAELAKAPKFFAHLFGLN